MVFREMKLLCDLIHGQRLGTVKLNVFARLLNVRIFPAVPLREKVGRKEVCHHGRKSVANISM